MARLSWDASGERLFETGVNQGVLYLKNASGLYPAGVAWNGLSSITEKPSGAEANAIYADNIKYLNLYSAEEFGATIEAYTYPDEFAECDGSASPEEGIYIGQQTRSMFGLCYRTELGNDAVGQNYGYKLHLIYGAQASPSERQYQTVNDSPEAITMSWDVNTTPVNVTGYKPTSLITIDSTKVTAADLKLLEDALYGVTAAEFSQTKTYAVGDYVTYTSGSPSTMKTYRCKEAITTAGAWDATKWDEITNPDAHLPLPDEVIAIFA